MDNIEQLYRISPFLRAIRQEELSIYGNWIDYDYVLTYVKSGTVEFKIDGALYQLRSGDAIIVPPFTHHLVSSPDETIVHYVVHFDLFYDPSREKLSEIGADRYDTSISTEEQLLGSRPIVVMLNDTQQLYMEEVLSSLIYKKQNTQNPWFPLQTKAALIDILALIFQCDEIKQSKDVTASPNWPFVRNAMEYINLHYTDSTLNNSAISSAVGISENYLCSIFKQLVGIGVHSYLLNTRIARAQELILNGKHSVTQIAELTGFTSIHTFCRTFKKITGRTPKSFGNTPLHNIDTRKTGLVGQ